MVASAVAWLDAETTRTRARTSVPGQRMASAPLKERWLRPPTRDRSLPSGMTGLHPSRPRGRRSTPSAGCGRCCRSGRDGKPRAPIPHNRLSRCTTPRPLRSSKLAKRLPSHCRSASILRGGLRGERDQIPPLLRCSSPSRPSLPSTGPGLQGACALEPRSRHGWRSIWRAWRGQSRSPRCPLLRTAPPRRDPR